jgi:Ring finger domain
MELATILKSPIDAVCKFWRFLDSPVPDSRLYRIEALEVYLRRPHLGIKYTKGEMRLGIAVQVLLSAYMIYPLTSPDLAFPWISFLVAGWLMTVNIATVALRCMVFYHLINIKQNLPLEDLRQQMRILFAKRLYSFNFWANLVCISSYACCFVAAIVMWKFMTEMPDLFIYSIVSLLRYFYSGHRFRTTFMQNNPRNPFDFVEIDYGDKEAFKTYPKLEERNTCSICLKKFEPTTKLVEFPCGNSHFFHIDCCFDWIKRRLNCPICRTEVFPE